MSYAHPVRWIRRLVLSGIVALLTVGAIDGACALGERWAYGAAWADGRPVGLYIDGPDGRWQLAPGAHLAGAWYDIHINTLGFRGPELAASKPADGLRVWCLGGSTTFDIYAPDDASTWPARLGARLGEALPARTVEVINAGIPGEFIAGNTADLQRLGRRLRPDLVVLHVGPNDLRAIVNRTDNVPPPRESPLQAFAAVRVLERIATARGRARSPETHRALRPGEREMLANALRGLAQQVVTLGATPIFVTHAMRAAPGLTGDEARRATGELSGLMGMDPASTIAAFDTWNDVVREVAGPAPVIDLRAAIPGDPALWGDATHFAAPGSDRAAAVLAEGILRQIDVP